MGLPSKGRSCPLCTTKLLCSRSTNFRENSFKKSVFINKSLTLREEHRLRVFENRVLMRIFGPKRDRVKGEWRKLHNEELNSLLLTQYCADNKIKKNEMGGGIWHVWRK